MSLETKSNSEFDADSNSRQQDLKQEDVKQQDVIKKVNIFTFLFVLIKTWSITATLNYFKLGKCDYVINCFFFNVHIVSSKTKQNLILRSKPTLAKLNENFSASHGFRYSIDRLESTDPLWKIMHISVKESLIDVVPEIKSSMKSAIDKYVCENLGSKLCFSEFVDDTTDEWFGQFLMNDVNKFKEIRQDVLKYFKYTFYSNPFRKVPYLGKLVSKIKKRLAQKDIRSIRTDLSKKIHETSFLGRLLKNISKHISDEQINISDQEVFIDNAILSFLVYDFVNMILKGALYMKICEKRQLKQSDINTILKDNFLFEYRGRIMTKDIESFKKNDLCLLNLVESELFFSAGERSCPGQIIVRPLLEEYIQIINRLDFLHNQDNTFEIIRSKDLDTPFIINSIKGFIHDRRILLNESKSKILVPIKNQTTNTSTFSGISLKNIWKLYTNPRIMSDVMNYYTYLKKTSIPEYDVIVAPEARALPLAGMISSNTPNNTKNKSMIDFKPIVVLTKDDKFGETDQIGYSRGYTDKKTNIHLYKVFEEDIKGKKVLLVDDGLASGGTTIACIKLVNNFGGNVVGIFVMVDHSYCDLTEEYQEKYAHITHSCYDL